MLRSQDEQHRCPECHDLMDYLLAPDLWVCANHGPKLTGQQAAEVSRRRQAIHAVRS